VLQIPLDVVCDVAVSLFKCDMPSPRRVKPEVSVVPKPNCDSVVSVPVLIATFADAIISFKSFSVDELLTICESCG
jgi:hypothetical protein